MHTRTHAHTDTRAHTHTRLLLLLGHLQTPHVDLSLGDVLNDITRGEAPARSDLGSTWNGILKNSPSQCLKLEEKLVSQCVLIHCEVS